MQKQNPSHATSRQSVLWGLTFIVGGFVLLFGLLFVAIVSKVLPPFGNGWLAAVQNDRLDVVQPNNTAASIWLGTVWKRFWEELVIVWLSTNIPVAAVEKYGRSAQLRTVVVYPAGTAPDHILLRAVPIPRFCGSG